MTRVHRGLTDQKSSETMLLARAAYNGMDHVILTQPASRETKKSLALLKSRYTSSLNKLDDRRDEVGDAEVKNGVAAEGRWTREHPERQAIASWLGRDEYNKALDKLERLIVMRLFELTKLNHSGTGKFSAVS
jgi:hypothetical protein